MPKVELNARLYSRLGVLTTSTMTVEMLVNRAVDEYLRAKMGSLQKGPQVRIPPRLR